MNELGARLVSALSALATLVAVFRWTAAVSDARPPAARCWSSRRRSGSSASDATAASTCCSRAGSRSAAVAAERLRGRSDADVLLVVAAVAAALGMLTKGLVAPLFVAGVPLVHALLAGGGSRASRAWVSALGIFLLVAGPWYVAARRARSELSPRALPPAPSRALRRVAALAFHPGPWWYYGPALALLFFPWSALLPAALAGRPSAANRRCATVSAGRP